MVTRVGGLASGMDIDSIVEKLMSAEKAPLTKLYQQQQKYEWERDAYRDVNTALSSFDDFLFDGYRLSSNFYKKTVSSTNSSLVTATATSAATGSLSIESVSQLASSARVVGNTINATSATKLSDFGITDSSIKINAIQTNGKLLDSAVEIKIDENETVSSLLTKINNSTAGITAIFENNKISFTAKNSGNNSTGGEIVIESGANVFNKLLNTTSFSNGSALADNGKNAIFTINGISTEKSSNSFTLNGYNITLRETFNSEQSLGQSFVAASENKANSDLNYSNMLDKDNTNSLANKYLSSSYAGTDPYADLNAFFESEAEIRSDKVEDTDANLTTAKNALILSSANFTTTEANNYNQLSKEVKDFIKGLTTAKLAEVENLSTLTAPTELTQEEFDYLKGLSGDDAKVLDFSATQLEEAKSAKTAGEIYNKLTTATKDFAKNYLTSSIDFTNLSADAQAAFDNLSTEEQDSLRNLNAESVAGIANIVQKAKNLELEQASLKELKSDMTNFNDIVASKNQNEAVYNTAKSTLMSTLLSTATTQTEKDTINNATDAELLQASQYLSESGASVSAVTLTSSTDVDSMVDKIKKFVETYNGLITNITGKTKESYDRTYQPLTDEQKEEMSEEEIEKWETKAKTGLLRNDSILTSGLYSLRNSFLNSVGGLGDATIDSLAELGITTSSTYSDGGKLVIDEDKLRAAIEKNADQVAAVFTQTGKVSKDENGKTVDTRGIAQRLRDELSKITSNVEKKAGKTASTNQTYTIGKRLDEIKDSIDNWLSKLENIESRYWKQFTAMETAINKANTQSSLFQTGY